MGYGLEDMNGEDEALEKALVLLALDWRPSWREIEEEVPWDVIRAALDYKSGQSARSRSESGPAFGEIIPD